jgi:putative hydrolase of the HAD superfamily
MLKEVQKLKNKSINCFLCTNNEKYRVDYNFNKLELNKYFDGIFYSAQIGHKKQEPEFWQKTYEILGYPDKKTVLFWDNSEDKLEAARKFGFTTEFFTDFKNYKNKIKKYTNNK